MLSAESSGDVRNFSQTNDAGTVAARLVPEPNSERQSRPFITTQNRAITAKLAYLIICSGRCSSALRACRCPVRDSPRAILRPKHHSAAPAHIAYLPVE